MPDLILTALFYLQPGEEQTFLEYEARVLPLLAHHGGELLARWRPAADALIAGSYEPPYEIHLLAFPDRAAFEAYRQNPERTQYTPLFQQAVKRAIILEGQQLN